MKENKYVVLKIEGRSYPLKYICQTIYDILLAIGLCKLSVNFNAWWIILFIFILAEKIGNSDEDINITFNDDFDKNNNNEIIDEK